MNPSDVQQLSKKYICCSKRVSCMCTDMFVCYSGGKKEGVCGKKACFLLLLSPSLITAVLAADCSNGDLAVREICICLP